jgi:hypothetical protein
MPDYTLYGLVVHSDLPLDGLETATAGHALDVRITLGAGAPPRAEPEAPVPYQQGGAHAQDGTDVRRDVHGNFWFRYADGTAFIVNAAATEIRAWWADSSTLADTATYLLGPVLGFALRRRGVLALHASAVIIDGRAVALVGWSGAGKSTTAAAFAAAGDAVLADDVVALRQVDGTVMAYPSYRLLRLWDESERIVFGTAGQLPLLTPTWDKRALPLGADFPFHAQAAPLGDVFVLAERSGDPRAPFAAPMGGADALMAIVSNTYANYLLDDAMRADEMRALGAALRGRRVFRLVPHEDPSRLGALLACIRAAVRDASSPDDDSRHS